VIPSRAVISVVVVNWNAGRALDRCLASLEADAAGGTEVVLVDNASTDDSTAAATRARPWVRVVASPANVGFARGANTGAATAGGDVLVFLNPDAVVEPGALARLCDALAADPRAGIAGGGLRDEDGAWQPAAARFGVLAHLLGDTTLGRLRERRRTDVHAVDWVVVTPGTTAIKGTAVTGDGTPYGFVAYGSGERERLRLVVWREKRRPPGSPDLE